MGDGEADVTPLSNETAEYYNQNINLSMTMTMTMTKYFIQPL